ncbi:UDP-N-acetylglucosamine 1-carboxyvinyltransferase [Pterulicium gracile]|uniref:uracil phosphoribosyltransferase n=1 Tax=Pterulicium gracile TaxID=1884261 RepID=A0A5C3QG35_9AGAR|nr:UDP-N-acetylglucosamine 1-carboxyvinyltransferase [Pterula gracilis]
MSAVHLLRHPLVSTILCQLRQASSSPKQFREAIHQISLILAIESSRDLETKPFNGQSPVAPFTAEIIKPRIGLTPILRAGHGMTDALLSMFPDAPVYHLGLFREKVSLSPVEYYSKLPPSPPVDMIYLLDPLIATGGTAIAAITMITDWGIPLSNIKFLSVLASQPGLDAILQQFPGLEIWVAAIDSELTAEGVITPGLGDTGDRIFNTVKTA